jgi:hypothetical protein
LSGGVSRHSLFDNSSIASPSWPGEEITVKSTIKLILASIALYALATITAEAQSTWKLSRDLLATNNQIAFSQGSNGVWYFLRSDSFVRHPITYQFLSAYNMPCVSDSVSHFVDGEACWQNPTLERDIYPIPLVGINATYSAQSPNGAFLIPKRSVFMHPSMSGLAVIGWKSPVSGVVDVSGFFSHLDQSCGNGVIWYVDSWTSAGNHQLATGTLPAVGPSQTFSLLSLSIAKGQLLYFVVDPNGGDDFCDTTGIDVTISQTK